MATEKKSKFMKPIGLMLGLLVVAAVVLYLNLGNVVKNAAEKIGTAALGVKVTIADMDISIPEKRVVVTGLRIGNPKGFKKPYLLSVDTINIAMESFAPELLIFSDITVTGTNINMEVVEGGTNLSALKKGLKPKPAKADKEKEQVKVIIRKLLIDDAKLNPSVTLIGGDLGSVTIPDLRMTGIGQKQKGVLASEAMAQVADRLTKAATKAAGPAGFLQGLSPAALSDMGISGVKGLATGVENVGEGLVGGIKGIFGN